MSRETEKVLKELQRFLDSHADEIKSEDDANAWKFAQTSSEYS